MEFNHFLIQAVQLKFEINIKGVYMWLKKKKKITCMVLVAYM